jgi:hypothetical protein
VPLDAFLIDIAGMFVSEWISITGIVIKDVLTELNHFPKSYER